MSTAVSQCPWFANPSALAAENGPAQIGIAPGPAHHVTAAIATRISPMT
jgi:hypothetical protein